MRSTHLYMCLPEPGDAVVIGFPTSERFMPVSVRRFGSLLLFVASAALLTACGGGNRVCSDTAAPYLQARNNAPLQIPQGMSEPDRSGAMAIPDVKPAARTTERTGCLDEPPSYFRSAGTMARSADEVVASWAQAWSSREADAVIELYSKDFRPPTDTANRTLWLQQRHEQVATGPLPDSRLESLRVVPDGDDRQVASFVHRFGTNALRKELVLVREAGSWRIIEEKVSDVK